MKNIKDLTSACRYCRYYQPEGRRGGMCQQLGAPVQANWKACSLSLPPFAPSWESLEDVWNLPDATPAIPSEIKKVVIASIEGTVSNTTEQPKAKVVIS
ncbi:hypothetical protein QUB80_27295 [Chlorogloeopsis sp. ULAP01]|uniref:hypothetical protein n=1 Tax=Chlorogloeopsis sp. ULAP01 TaxID=3056483 RepID=UPI0025AA759B|nr:hypothetical protein [Chlorogloeopsis sp. ULAP01]MDM9384382.1 hypothetical protein [Chlorogloeopsis sp. ULAP01]